MASNFNPKPPTKPSSVPYFYGRITRDEAEEILKEQGFVEGMFLLRESINPLGNYAVSLCHVGRVHHYSIEKQTDGSYMIPSGKKFPGPVELIYHHRNQKDGIVTLLSVGCDRHPSQVPVAFRGMTYSDLEQELIRKANSIKGVNKERALGAQREHLVIMVAKDLHQKQPWYHGKIGRTESENRLSNSGHKDGKFLVRLRDDKKTFAIGISYQKDTRHYLIDKDENNKFGIQDGPKFDCIMMLVDHYHNKQDGLLRKLTEPCPSPGYNAEQLKKYMDCNVGNLDYYLMKNTRGRRPSAPMPPTPGQETPPPLPSVAKRPSLKDRLANKVGIKKRELPPTPDDAQNRLLDAGDWEGSQGNSHIGFDSRRVTLQRLGMDADRLEDIYGSVPRTLAHFDLKPDQVDLQETLGSGQFGSVCKGMCTLRSSQKIPVAVKTLKQEDCPSSQEPELLREAKVMMPLSHKHIVRMIGVCKSDSIMLVLELAPLGQLNNFLKSHKETSQANIVELLWQVAMGMEYLESKKFVHRDLAARNVLLVSEHFAKISDFGMSKALCRDNNYYEAKEAGKWPLKWYAPECVYFWKFDSKSDVWSYGVTMWEATSYGDRPYNKMKGQEILHFLVEEGRRLPKPEFCDEEVYGVMLQCWEYDKHDRPTFLEIASFMASIYRRMSQESIS
ncbi:tyrosine-protein kinase SYK-like [Mercenaria mercenaria]|uniref:tyrosine-protein kinase SYK-like n=1 Tax=Mercenaria mercenaria TaxID=6596 RepID=UPI00234ED157|nr:tyrosine-protein kinase SYK-like [Mercenaria mercenaria]